MKYLGSKNRIAKELLLIILKNRKENQWYVEPFVGGCNMVDKVTGNRIGNDVNSYLIKMWKAVQQGWIPPEFISEEKYQEIKNNKEKFTPKLVGFVGVGCSYAGKWFGGYARGTNSKNIPRNYCNESKKNIQKQTSKIKDVVFLNLDYKQLKIPPNSIIYCDPPYSNTTGYGKIKFDHKNFWEWCEQKSLEGHQVFVSEYSAPSNWKCVWSKKNNSAFTNHLKNKEKLFVL